MTFRNLFPSEIQIRPTDTKYKGSATLLLYQDARCAMDILDETIGSDKWQKEYYDRCYVNACRMLSEHYRGSGEYERELLFLKNALRLDPYSEQLVHDILVCCSALGKPDKVMIESPLQRFFDRQLETWADVRRRYRELNSVKTRELSIGASTVVLQWNPARIGSTGAKIDSRSLSERPCFLCAKNRPKEQLKRTVDGKWELLVNPFPILPMHFTLPTLKHQPQAIKDMYGEIYRLLANYPELMVFYNGPKCGASAPDHAHLQAGVPGRLPLLDSWQRLSRELTPVVSLSPSPFSQSPLPPISPTPPASSPTGPWSRLAGGRGRGGCPRRPWAGSARTCR